MNANRNDGNIGNANDAAAQGASVTDAANEAAGARSMMPEGADPNLLASQAKSTVEGIAGASEIAASDPGGQSAPLSGGRIDANAATVGRHTGNQGGAAVGGPVSSVGGPQGDRPGEGPADFASRGGQAGFLEGTGGREGANSSGGEEFDAEGGQLRSMSDAAVASADSGTPNEGEGRTPDDVSAGEASAQRHGVGETDFATHGMGGEDMA